MVDTVQYGQPHTTNRLNANAEVEWIVQENQQVTIIEVAVKMKIGHGSANYIIQSAAVLKSLY